MPKNIQVFLRKFYSEFTYLITGTVPERRHQIGNSSTQVVRHAYSRVSMFFSQFDERLLSNRKERNFKLDRDSFRRFHFILQGILESSSILKTFLDHPQDDTVISDNSKLGNITWKQNKFENTIINLKIHINLVTSILTWKRHY